MDGLVRIMTRRQFTARLATLAAIPIGAGTRLRGQSATSAIGPPADSVVANLAKLMEIAGVPGVGIGVVRVGQPLWERYLGVADAGTKLPVTPETMFPAASLGKPVMAWAALRLSDTGALDLSKPLKSYVPDHAPADPRGDLVTARHVLSHSSGYRNWRQPGQTLVPEFDPGARFQYSGEGFYYLQRAIEAVERKGFEQAIQELLLMPFGMKSSTYAWRAGIEARLVAGHSRGMPVRQPTRDFSARLFQYAEAQGRSLASFTHDDVIAAMSKMQPSPPQLPNFMIPNAAGSLLTTVQDYSVFLTRVLSPGQHLLTLRRPTWESMISSVTPINSVLSWGLGWGLERDRNREYLWHWGDNGQFKNFALAHPASRTGVVVFTNGVNGMRVCEAVVEAAAGQAVSAFDWL
jgi:CubicO group peptidase (beta-lactamase class C family)